MYTEPAHYTHGATFALISPAWIAREGGHAVIKRGPGHGFHEQNMRGRAARWASSAFRVHSKCAVAPTPLLSSAVATCVHMYGVPLGRRRHSWTQHTAHATGNASRLQAHDQGHMTNKAEDRQHFPKSQKKGVSTSIQYAFITTCNSCPCQLEVCAERERERYVKVPRSGSQVTGFFLVLTSCLVECLKSKG